jgi:hypothetical protein
MHADKVLTATLTADNLQLTATLTAIVFRRTTTMKCLPANSAVLLGEAAKGRCLRNPR